MADDREGLELQMTTDEREKHILLLEHAEACETASQKYDLTRAPNHLDEAIQQLRNISELCDVAKCFEQEKWLHLLGRALETRYKLNKNLPDLDEAIEIVSSAILMCESDSKHPIWFRDLGRICSRRYRHKGDLGDLEFAIGCQRKGLDLIPDHHPDRQKLVNDLASSLHRQHEQSGSLVELDESIQLMRLVISETTVNDEERPKRLSNLAGALGNRYRHMGAIADLDESLRVSREAVSITHVGGSDRAVRLTNLGSQLRGLYERTHVFPYLDEAVNVSREAVAAAPMNSQVWSIASSNLGVMLSTRYHLTKNLPDLEESIRVIRQALGAERVDFDDRAMWASNLGCALLARYERTGAADDLRTAIQVIRQATINMPTNRQLQTVASGNLGYGLGRQYQLTNTPMDLAEALSQYESVLHQADLPVIDRLFAGRVVLAGYAHTRSWNDAYETSKMIIGLIPELSRRSFELSDTQYRLNSISELACAAAAMAFNAGAGLDALHLLESGRGVLATNLKDKRTDVSMLQQAFPNMATQFSQLCRDLESREVTEGITFKEGYPSSAFDRVAQRSTINDKLNELIQDVRSQPGFETFLSAPTNEVMCNAARSGPVIVISVSRYRCDAIIIRENRIQGLYLPDLHHQDIENEVAGDAVRSRRVLRWLWDAAAKQILDAIGFTHAPLGQKWPHVWWVLTGLLTKFPIHAAGHHTPGSDDSVIDRVTSSYATSVKALVQSQSCPSVNPEPTREQAVLVAMEDTPDHPVRLHFANQEVKLVHDICKSMGLNATEPERSKEHVLACIQTCKIFHFAGHGCASRIDPSKSYISLQDWKTDPLMVANLLDLDIGRSSSSFLAFLSACGTSQARDRQLLDESIHLASAFQLAGFRHVIGTLWEVKDETCVDMAQITYEGIRKGGMSDESVCLGLHEAYRALRKRTWDTRSSRGSVFDKRTHYECDSQRTTQLARKSDGNLSADGSHRDIVPYDDDGDSHESDHERAQSFQWTSYVHYGV